MRRLVTAAVIAGMLAVLPACGNRTDEASRAAGMVPADTIAFVSASLDPSIAQKKNMLDIARKFPKARDKVRSNFQDTRDAFLSDAVKDACLDYAKDVKPWLGSELAVAALARPGGKGADSVLLIRAKDEAKARQALEAAGRCNTSTAKDARDFRFVNGFAVIATGDDSSQNAIVLDDIAKQSKSNAGSLAKSDKFVRLEAKLHGDRLLFGYVDGDRALQASGAERSTGNCNFFRGGGFGSVAVFDLHVESSSVVLEGVGDAPNSQFKSGAPKLTQGLPSTSTGAFTLFDVAGIVNSALDCSGSSADLKSQLREQAGLDLDADVLSWMGGESVVVSGPFNSSRSFPEFGLVVQPTDQAKAQSALDKIKAKLAEQGDELTDFDVNGTKGAMVARAAANGIQPAVVLLPDRFIMATSPAFVKELASTSSSSFGGTPAYKGVVGSGTGNGTQMQLVVDIAAIKDAIVKNLAPQERRTYEKDIGPQVDPLDAFGLRLFQQDGFSHIEVKLTLK